MRTLKLYYLVPVIAMLVCFSLYRYRIDGDATIYFIFIKNFFNLPFSYQPETVSFGATSPMHVLIFSPFFQVFQQNWLPVAKCINLLMIAVALILLNKALLGKSKSLIFLTILTLLNVPLIIYTVSLFETGLVFLGISLLLYLFQRNLTRYVILLSGSLYLIRPELVLIFVTLSLYYLLITDDKLKLVQWISISLIPLLIYHGYMFYHTGELLPSSVIGRRLVASENRLSWIQKLISFKVIFTNLYGLFYFISLLFSALLITLSGWRKYLKLGLIVFPILIFYLIFPPAGGYIVRYLLPVTPCIIFIMADYLLPQLITIPKWLVLSAAPFLLCLLIWKEAGHKRYNLDLLLMKDLGTILNPVTGDNDKIIIYEIQGQYHLKAFCLSADAIVGRHLLPVLKKEETFNEFLRKNQVKYIATINNFYTRKLYKSTIFEKLYLHDLHHKINSEIVIDGVSYRKILSNKYFSDPKYYKWVEESGKMLRVYGTFDKNLESDLIEWNSIYKIIESSNQ